MEITKQILSRIIQVSIFLIVPYFLGVYSFFSKQADQTSKDRKEWLPLEEAKPIAERYVAKIDSLSQIIEMSDKKGNFDFRAYYELHNLCNKMNGDARLGKIILNRDYLLYTQATNSFAHAHSLAVQKLEQRGPKWQEFEQIRCEMIGDCGITKQEQQQNRERTLNWILFTALPWVVNRYFIFMLLFVIACVNRIWRDRDNSVALDPRNILSFVVRLPLYPFFLIKHLQENIFWRMYGDDKIALLSDDDKILLEKLVKKAHLREFQTFMRERNIEQKYTFFAASFLILVSTSGLPEISDSILYHTGGTKQISIDASQGQGGQIIDCVQIVKPPGGTAFVFSEGDFREIVCNSRMKFLELVDIISKIFLDTESPPPKERSLFVDSIFFINI